MTTLENEGLSMLLLRDGSDGIILLRCPTEQNGYTAECLILINLGSNL